MCYYRIRNWDPERLSKNNSYYKCTTSWALSERVHFSHFIFTTSLWGRKMSGNLPRSLSQQMAKLGSEPWEPAVPAYTLRLPCPGHIAEEVELGFDPRPILLSDIAQHATRCTHPISIFQALLTFLPFLAVFSCSLVFPGSNSNCILV